MTMGIDHFRGLAKLDDLENRRVKFQQDENGKWHMLAQDHLWGRLVSWWHRNDPVDPEHYKTIQNNQVRKAFYEALVKAEGKTFADHLIDKVFGENAHQTFQTRGRSLQASRITQVLTLAETEREKNTTRTLRDLQSYQDSGRMGTHTRTYAKALGHDDFRSNDPELRKTLLHLVKSHPDYGRKRFTEDELKELTREATRRCCEAKQKRFEEQYPGLSRLEHAPFHDIDTFFTKMLQDLRGPPVNDQLQPFENLARDALGLIQGTYKVSSDMRFDPAELSGRMAILTDRKAALQQRLENLTSNEIDEALFANDDPETLQARELRAALCIELETQIGKLDAKLAFFGDYLKHDPLSDKAIAYHKLILRQASRQMLEDLAEETALKAMVLPVRNQPGWSTQVEEQRRKFQEQMTALKHAINHADDRIALAKDELEKAGTDRKPMSERNRQIKQDRTDEVNFVSRYFDLIGHSLPFLVTVAKQHDQAQVKVLDTVQEWHVISRDFSTSRDGVDRNYRSVMKPGPKLDGPVGQSYEKDGIKGVSAGNKTEPNHPRNLWVSELYRVEKVTDPETGKVQIDPETGKEMEITVKLSQTIRHGVVDPWNIEDPEKRKEASEAGVEEVLTTAVDINENFKKRALQKKLHPEREDPNTFVNGRPKRNKIVHVNLNLTTADTTLLRKPMRDYREGDFTINQFDAFASYNGTHALKVQVANDNVPPEGEDDQVGGNVGGNGVDGNVNEDGNVNQVGNVDNGVNGPNGNDDLDQMSRIFEDAPRNPPNENNQNGPPQQELIFIDLPNVNPIPLNVLNLQNEVGGNVQQEPLILELPPNVNNPPGNVQVGGNEQPNPLVLNLDDIDNPPNVPPNQGENLNPVPGNLQGNNDNQVGQNLPQNLLNLPDDVDPNAILDIDELLNQGNPNGQVNQDGDVNQGNGVNQNGPVNQVDGGAPGIDEDGNTENRVRH